MLIDVSTKPIRIIVDECSRSVIIRTLAGRDADGFVIQNAQDQKYKRRAASIEPLGRLLKGPYTCMEFRLPQLKADPDPYRGAGDHADPRSYVCVTFFKDLFSHRLGVWRINIIVEHDKGQHWLVTIQDETNDLPLATLASKELDDAPEALFNELSPVQRYLKTKESRNTVWDRLLID